MTFFNLVRFTYCPIDDFGEGRKFAGFAINKLINIRVAVKPFKLLVETKKKVHIFSSSCHKVLTK
jgi:hypothetical protein